MSGKLSIYDAFVTVGAFILALGLYQHVKPLLSYASTSTDEPANVTEVGDVVSARPYSYKRCLQVAHPKCCQAAQGGGITDDELSNCHLCNHPNCEHFQTIGPGGDPTLPPFQPGTYKVALQDIGYKDSNYAYAYATDEPDVVPDYYPPIRPTRPEESENDLRSRRWTKKYGCRKVPYGADNKWTNICTGVGSGEGVHVAPAYGSGDGPSDYELGQSQTQSSVYARAYRVTYV